MTDPKWIIFDEDIIPAGVPVASATSRGLMYGDGAFETIRTYQSHTFLLGDHLRRLRNSLQMLDISVPEVMGTPAFDNLLSRLLQRNNLADKDAVIRLQVWREGNRGYGINGANTSHFTMVASEIHSTFESPALALVNTRRIPSEALPSGHKVSNGLNYILAAREAEKKGMDDALMRTLSGTISETTIANIFWINNGTIYTPSEDCDILPGITRQVVLHLIEQNDNWTVRRGKYTIKDILEAEAVWLTNSVRELLPVRQIGEVKFQEDHEVIEALYQQFIAYRQRRLKKLVE